VKSVYAVGIVSALFVYAVWQGPFHGKWPEATFWLVMSLSLELSHHLTRKGAE
jgi:hypothetical protein